VRHAWWALLLAGCVSGNYTRMLVNEPIDDARIAALSAGSDLQVCLDALGAPARVWETDAGRFAVAYGWIRQRGWSIRASYPLASFFSASISYEDRLRKMRGAVLWFDSDLKLVEAKTGQLADLLPRRRPASPEWEDAVAPGAGAGA